MAVALGALLVWRPPRGALRANYAGRPVPAVLGAALVPAVVAGSLLAVRLAGPLAPLGVRGDLLVFALVVVWVAGSIDDAFGGEARGLAGHLRSLLRGQPTTGILKLVAGVGAAIAVALGMGGGPVRVAAGAVLIAAATNLWNALDVVPGRALKWALVSMVLLLAAGWHSERGLVAAAALAAALAILPFDLRELGMLGDGGSNPLGFLVGTGVAVALPTAAVVVAAVGALALQAAAETVTLSRLLEAVPPLRWFDRLGRRR